MCRDYNLTADYKIDTASKSKSPLPTLQPLLNIEDVYDVWRCQHANEQDYTFHLSRHNSNSRINLILVDKMFILATGFELFTDGAGSRGFCNVWPEAWMDQKATRNIVLLELFPLVVALEI